MPQSRHPLSRRDFLKLAGLGLGAAALHPWSRIPVAAAQAVPARLPEFPQGVLLGRNNTADTNLEWGGTIPIQARPDITSGIIRDSHADEVFPWISEASAESLNLNNPNQRWVETPEGYIWAPYLQPCKNIPNTPLTALPDGKTGFWGEVTVPYVDLIVESGNSGWLRDHLSYSRATRLYYSQIMWIDRIRTSDDGTIQYHVNERYGNPGDLFWADGAAFRPLTEDDISPIHPEIDPATKQIVVNVNYQTLSCREAGREVYFCRVSTGVSEGSTPLGEHSIWRKLISVRMAANTVATSYDLPGIAWTTLFVGTGVAIHATTSHNDFGAVRSHGCVNCRPEDAKWIFRWTQPSVELEPGEKTWSDWARGSTHVVVQDFI